MNTMQKIFVFNNGIDRFDKQFDCIEIVELPEINTDFTILSEWFDIKKNRKISVSEIRTSLAHYNIWKNIVDNKLKYALILENDIVFSDGFDETLANLSNIVFDYDLMYIGRNKSCDDIEVNKILVKPGYTTESFGYILTNSGAQKLINSNFINKLLPVDEFFSIMGCRNYPSKLYSVFFDDCEKLHSLALKINIVNKIKKQNKNAMSYLDLLSRKTVIYNEKIHKKNQSELVKSWYLDNIPNAVSLLEKNKTFLLRKICDNSFDTLERFIYQIVFFHLKSQNKNCNDIEVTFTYKTCSDSVLQIEKGEPFFTTVTYLTDNHESPTSVTNFDSENFKFKCFDGEKIICFSFPEINKHISFEGGKYFHVHSNNNSILVINFYKNKKVENIPYYVPSDGNNEVADCRNLQNLDLFQELESKVTVVDESMMDQQFLEKFCYEYDETLFKNFVNDKSSSTQIFMVVDKPDYIIQNFSFMYNPFLPNFYFKKHFSKCICSWLILEAENHIRPNIRKSVSLFNVSVLYNFLKISFIENIIPLIKKSFEISTSAVNFNILDLFITKYEKGEPDSKNVNKCNITISIMLSDITSILIRKVSILLFFKKDMFFIFV